MNLREVRVDDADFILQLRTSEKGKRFLHHTDSDVGAQIEYLKRYMAKDDEWYFIVENKDGMRIGCLSIYDIEGDSVCTGRWVMKEGVPFQQSIEADFMLKEFAFSALSASEVRMDTKHENLNMKAYFKMWGCSVVTEDEELIYVVLSRETYQKNVARVSRFCY